jgi:hypothetical protein
MTRLLAWLRDVGLLDIENIVTLLGLTHGVITLPGLMALVMLAAKR